jgi:hypothetical protein
MTPVQRSPVLLNTDAVGLGYRFRAARPTE